MPRRPLTFRQRDLAAAIRTAKAAGLAVAAYEISKDGTIRIIPGEPEKAEDANPEREAIFEALRRGEDPDTGVTTKEEWDRFENERFGREAVESFRDGLAGGREARQWQDLGLPKYTAKVLAWRGIHTLSELAKLSDGEMLKLPGFGPHSLDAVHRLLKKKRPEAR